MQICILFIRKGDVDRSKPFEFKKFQPIQDKLKDNFRKIFLEKLQATFGMVINTQKEIEQGVRRCLINWKTTTGCKTPHKMCAKELFEKNLTDWVIYDEKTPNIDQFYVL